MGKSPIDQSRPSDARAAREYARVEREHGDPMSDPKVKSFRKVAPGTARPSAPGAPAPPRRASAPAA